MDEETLEQLSASASDLSDALENLNVETPAEGGAVEEIKEEIAPLIEELAEELAELSDKTAEITAQIIEASRHEAEVKKIDEERGNIFEDIEEEIDDVLPKSNGGAIVASLLFFGAFVLFVQKLKRNPDEQRAPIDNHTENKTQQYTDGSGMIYGN